MFTTHFCSRVLSLLIVSCISFPFDFPAHAANKNLHSDFTIEEDGHGEGRDLVVLDWKTTDGEDAATMHIPITGLGRIGPVSLKMDALGSDPHSFEWDTREWQWWKGFPRKFGGPNDEFVRLVPATGGAERDGDRIRVWTKYTSDGVAMTQEWFFRDLDRPDETVYDCLITITNVGERDLEEYGQLFANYTDWNDKRGHFFWQHDGVLVNFSERGSRHLNYFVVAEDSPYMKMGRIPHCARGDGKVGTAWKHPVSISQPGPNGHRHLILCEEASTAGIAQGGSGPPQDYALAPPGGTLKPHQPLRAHVRHLIVRVDADDLPARLDVWWEDFTADHQRVHGMSEFQP